MTKVFKPYEDVWFDASYLENDNYDLITLLAIDVTRVGSCLASSWVHLSISTGLMIKDLIIHIKSHPYSSCKLHNYTHIAFSKESLRSIDAINSDYINHT